MQWPGRPCFPPFSPRFTTDDTPAPAGLQTGGIPASGRVAEALEAVEEEVEPELVRVHVVVVGLHVLQGVLGEVGVGITALQALRDHGQVQPGHKVLINGASGGVGTLRGAARKVVRSRSHGRVSTGNVEQARSLGAVRVVDYTQEDFTKRGERHDLMLDIAGSRSFLACRRVLTPEATVVVVGGPMTYRGLGPLPHIAGTILKSRGRSQTVTFFVAEITTEDLEVLRELLETGKVTPVIDRKYPLSEAPEALTYLGEGHARGKVVITV